MRRQIWPALLVIAMSCSDPEQGVPPSSSAEPTRVAPANQPATTSSPASPAPVARQSPVAVPKERPEIWIDNVAAGNPIVVKGHARTFENSVSSRLRDARGALIVETHVTSVGAMGTHNPFEAQLWLVADPGEQVTVEAFEYSAKDGSVRSLARKTTAYAVDRVPIRLLFPAGDCDRLGTFTRQVPKSKAMARLLVEALLAGPTSPERARGATPAFPDRGGEVRSVILREGELTVDFDESLRNVGGACAAQAIRASVTQTLQQLPTVKRVVITAGGSRELALQP